MPSKVWVVGEEVLAADFNAYVQEQVVATFPNAAARTAAIIAPKDGQTTWLADVDSLEVYNGAAWQRIVSQPLLGYATSTTGGVTAAAPGAVAIGLTLPALVAGRTYRLAVHGGFSWEANAGMLIWLGQPGAAPGTVLRYLYKVSPNWPAGEASVSAFADLQGPFAAGTWEVRIARASATGSVYYIFDQAGAAATFTCQELG